jgi:hypothetical protein
MNKHFVYRECACFVIQAISKALQTSLRSVICISLHHTTGINSHNVLFLFLYTHDHVVSILVRSSAAPAA